MMASTATEHKALGKKVTPFDAEQWSKVTYKVVLEATVLKFTVSDKATPLRAELLKTGNREIVEASSDTVWGCGLTLSKAKTLMGEEWPGKNSLGKAVMEVHQIREEENKKNKKEIEVEDGDKK
ncbi:DUF1768-domain-containing protein [Byssothecium circinans]|uniref:DUF1768-domain-containing protein n=1 Tax=Byssothecium circinans TaxID=147558 RepID=A0A6A5TWD5_9PLEO|nr:DUF1768-domain-containing protein [Byssothecium circinans]